MTYFRIIFVYSILCVKKNLCRATYIERTRDFIHIIVVDLFKTSIKCRTNDANNRAHFNNMEYYSLNTQPGLNSTLVILQ